MQKSTRLQRLKALSVPSGLGISPDQLAELRQRGREDLFVFAKEILGYSRLSASIHGEWASWATDFINLRRCRLEPRGCFKTSLLVISFALWVLIQERKILRGIEGRNLRLLIASDSTERAKDMLKELSRHVRTNELFRACYGDLKTGDDTWNASQLVFANRTRNYKEPSIQAAGRGQQLTSAHYDACLVDDVVSNDDRQSATERQLTKQWMSDLMSLVEVDGLVQLTGTRWHADDFYGEVLHVINPALKSARAKPYSIVIESAYTEDQEAKFKEIGLTAKELQRLKIEKGSLDFAAQYLNQPLPAESLIFTEDSLQYYESLPPEGLEFFGYCDPSVGASKKSDYSCTVTLGRHKETGEVYLIEADMQRRSVGLLRASIVSRFHQWRYKKFGGEQQGFEAAIWDELEGDLKREFKPFRIARVRHSSEKVGRIQAAESAIKAVRFPARCRETMPEQMAQLFNFPFASNDDFCDALEGCLSLLSKGGNLEDMLRILLINSKATSPLVMAQELSVEGSGRVARYMDF